MSVLSSRMQAPPVPPRSPRQSPVPPRSPGQSPIPPRHQSQSPHHQSNPHLQQHYGGRHQQQGDLYPPLGVQQQREHHQPEMDQWGANYPSYPVNQHHQGGPSDPASQHQRTRYSSDPANQLHQGTQNHHHQGTRYPSDPVNQHHQGVQYQHHQGVQYQHYQGVQNQRNQGTRYQSDPANQLHQGVENQHQHGGHYPSDPANLHHQGVQYQHYEGTHYPSDPLHQGVQIQHQHGGHYPSDPANLHQPGVHYPLEPVDQHPPGAHYQPQVENHPQHGTYYQNDVLQQQEAQFQPHEMLHQQHRMPHGSQHNISQIPQVTTPPNHNGVNHQPDETSVTSSVVSSYDYNSPSLITGRASPNCSGQSMRHSMYSSTSQKSRSLDYHNISIDKSHSLGTGSYGAVYRAKCDELLCAAKVMHGILSSRDDHGPSVPLQKFHEECELLSMTRHPNIVQYLQTCIDEDSGHPVLLMELCDESLTTFLERSPDRLPYHIQLNICHDIALALVYLHSNGLIHRDLTSNNVLMDHGKAKVTDFGMSKLTGIQVRPTTKCPGNPVYMPPEALTDSPQYTEKLDIFSFGVLVVQIITREFPNPKDRYTTEQVPPSEQFPDGVIHRLLSEEARRHNHLRLIEGTHPLKPIALQCLSDKQEKRDTAKELSSKLFDLKSEPKFTDSLKLMERHRSQSAPHQLQMKSVELERHYKSLESDLRKKLQDTEQHHQSIQDSLRAELRSSHEQIHQAKQQLAHVVDTRNALEQTRDELRIAHHKYDEKCKELEKTKHELKHSHIRYDEKCKELEKAKYDLKKQEEFLAEMLDNKQVTPCSVTPSGEVKELRQKLKQREMEIEERGRESEARIRYLENELERTRQDSERAWHVVPKGAEQGVEADMRELQWEVVERSPVELSAGSAVTIGENVYVASDKKLVYCYNRLRKWSTLPECDCERFSLAVVDGSLVTVGGWDGEYTNKLGRFTDQRTWNNKDLPAMPTPRTEPITLSTDQYLIAAGGYSGTRALDTVEVLTIQEKQWTTCSSSLPHIVYGGSMSLIDNQIYLAPRNVESVNTQQMVLTCNLSDLKQQKKKSLFGRGSGPWQRVKDLPVPLASVVAMNGRLLAIGGKDSRNSPTYASTTVWEYTPTQGWKSVSQIPNGRWSSISAVLPRNQLIVVGGQSNWTKTNFVEIATL